MSTGAFGEVLPTLAKWCVDEHSVLRIAARTALNEIKPEKAVISAMLILPDFKAGLLFFFVRHSFSFNPRTKCKTVPFVLHTTFSLKIGKWSKDVLGPIGSAIGLSASRLRCEESRTGILTGESVREYIG